MKIYYFERLDVWQNAKSLSVMIYKLTQHFPSEERFGITSQLRRAVTSIAANIAEGSGRPTGKEKRRFISMAYSSTLEVLNFVIISRELNYLPEDAVITLRAEIELITNQLNKLHKSISV